MTDTKGLLEYKVCNSISCYYANELAYEDNNFKICSSNNDCKFCSYNVHNLYKIKKIIKEELKKNNNKKEPPRR